MSILKLKIAGGGTQTDGQSFTTPQDLYINAGTIKQIGLGRLIFGAANSTGQLLALRFECSDQEKLFTAIEQALSANPGGSVVNVQLPEGVEVAGARLGLFEL